ncbi:protein-L-isoaspartate O-methyltransferase family protein [Ramlibacter alkalitolerans]|jgi:protein-L-isoaspartate(D-aspartate) O-methyltransferase|uniref:Protein-L-isoaspartate O-methyltransferase n=1 Tax=Ramlibacter alkalitolerans TaxID=2039631 RepID=A0ABS1JJD1_9BURK|nr:protein-L-isoaspartate O-methyltransferase [Ramlibacter alkalitolerans]MBL0424221.1 protein-L-isoaspartate O-methyltransferase [Ramlibacter alkalitolerans]
MTAPIDIERARYNMIEQQIRPWDVLDLDVLGLLQEVRREEFVPLAHKALAFVDMEIPLLADTDEAIRKGWSMLPPKVEARMLQDVAPKAHEKVLEVGAGSGHMAALLASRAQRVISLELQPELARMARENLQKAGIHNAEVREGDGAKGLAAEGPFDAIVLSGSVHEVPQVLLQQLKIGGRLAAIVGDAPVMRATIVTRTGEAEWESKQPWDITAPRLANFPEPSRFHF